MIFQINQNSTLPQLRMELINDGRNDYKKFFEDIQDSDITFCMTNIETGVKKIGNRPATCILKECINEDGCINEEYYIGYNWRAKDVNEAGTFIGEFTISFSDGNILIVPIKESLEIQILNQGLFK